jgi:hypothetical protein
MLLLIQATKERKEPYKIELDTYSLNLAYKISDTLKIPAIVKNY